MTISHAPFAEKYLPTQSISNAHIDSANNALRNIFDPIQRNPVRIVVVG